MCEKKINCIYNDTSLTGENFNDDNNVILAKAAKGDTEAFRLIFDNYWNFVAANAQRFIKSEDTAHDLAQEVFIRLWTFRQRLACVVNFEGYLIKMLRNAFYDSLKKNFKDCATLDEILNTEDEIKVYSQLEAKELEEHINEAIENLPEQMQRAFKLSRFENLTHEQISKVMSISKNTSQNYIARSIIYIRKHLSQYASLLIMALFIFSKK